MVSKYYWLEEINLSSSEYWRKYWNKIIEHEISGLLQMWCEKKWQNEIVHNEINVRFWGWVIFWALAGCDFVKYLVSWDDRWINSLQDGYYSRFLQEILISCG